MPSLRRYPSGPVLTRADIAAHSEPVPIVFAYTWDGENRLTGVTGSEVFCRNGPVKARRQFPVRRFVAFTIHISLFPEFQIESVFPDQRQ
jgi:hypothetical protein